MRRLALLLTAVALLGGAALAGGAAARAPRRAALELSLRDVNGPVGAIFSGASWRVRAVLTRYVPRQRVRLEVLRDGVRVLSRALTVRRSGGEGVAAATLRLGGVGRLTIRAVHRRASAQRSLWLVAPRLAAGERSYAARILQYQLSRRHYVIGAPGVYDNQTQWAVMAFRKLAGLPRNFVADASVFRALAAGAGAFPVRYPQHGRHVEADLTHQVLALIGAGGTVERIYAMSSGKPTTPTTPGNYSVYLQTPGINSEGMVDSSYFNGGDAIHGYAEVPTYAASHGCLRVWIPDALSIFHWIRIGTPVDVYDR